MFALIAAEPGKLRDGLYSLLVTCPEVDGISFIDDLEKASGWVEKNPKSIIVLYPSFPFNKMLWAIQSIKRQDSASMVIVITTGQTEATTALKAGGDGVLLRGFSSKQLYQLIGRLIDKRDARNTLFGTPIGKVDID